MPIESLLFILKKKNRGIVNIPLNYMFINIGTNKVILIKLIGNKRFELLKVYYY